MSMIKCTECGKEISDKATACPHCGCPMTEILSATKENKKEEKVKPIKIKEPINSRTEKEENLHYECDSICFDCCGSFDLVFWN